MRVRGLLPVLVVAAFVAAPAAAPAATESVTVGGTTAQLSYDKAKIGFKNMREKITRGGATFVDQPAGFSSICPSCPPAPAFAGRAPSVSIVQLDSTPEPEVIFDLYTGGAHCCFYSQIFRFSAGAYTNITQDWLDPGYVLKDLNGDGLPEFRSADGRFAYAFGSFAGSRFPPQIWRYESGKLIDVTKQFPTLVSADASKLRRLYKRNPQRLGLTQILLGYTADECLLNSCSTGYKLIKTASARGDIAHGGRFLGRVKRFLDKLGYA